jgi:hypothetical protein
VKIKQGEKYGSLSYLAYVPYCLPRIPSQNNPPCTTCRCPHTGLSTDITVDIRAFSDVNNWESISYCLIHPFIFLCGSMSQEKNYMVLIVTPKAKRKMFPPPRLALLGTT